MVDHTYLAFLLLGISLLATACDRAQPGKREPTRTDSLKVLAMLPADLEVDSCTLVDSAEYYDQATLYKKINGGDGFYLQYGFQFCFYQTYLYPNPSLKQGQEFTLMLNQMVNADSALAIYQGTIASTDSVIPLNGIKDQAAVTPFSWNDACIMVKGKYFIQFNGVFYDTTAGAQDAIQNKFKEFCTVFDNKIP